MPMTREPHSLIGAMFQTVPGNSGDYRRPGLERRTQRQREKELAKDMVLTKKSRLYKVENAGQEWVEKRFDGAKRSPKPRNSKLPNVNSGTSETEYSDGEIIKACSSSLPTQYPQYLGQVMAYSPYKTPFKRPTTIPAGFRGNRFLQHPDLKRGQKSYLWHIAAIYDISNMKKLHQNNYERVLLNQEALGFLDSQEFKRYWRYLKGSRKTQFDTDYSIWREPPKIKPRLTRSHSVNEYSQRALKEQEMESKRSQSAMALRPTPPQTPRSKKEPRSPRTLIHRKGKVLAQNLDDSGDSKNSKEKDGKTSSDESSCNEAQTSHGRSKDTSEKGNTNTTKQKSSKKENKLASQRVKKEDSNVDNKEQEDLKESTSADDRPTNQKDSKESASADDSPTNQKEEDQQESPKDSTAQEAQEEIKTDEVKETSTEEEEAATSDDRDEFNESDRLSPEY